MATAAMGTGAPVRGMPVKQSVCRCLFGRPTPEELAESTSRARLSVELAVKEKSVEYGFDFVTDTPITDDERWSWQRISGDLSTTAATASCRSSDRSSDDDSQRPPQGDVLLSDVAEVRSAADASIADDRRLADDSRLESDVPIASPAVDEHIESLPADMTNVEVDVRTTTSPTTSRKRTGAKTMTDFYPVKKPRSMTTLATSKEGSTSSDSS